MEQELKIKDIEHMQMQEMLEIAEVKFINVLFLLESAIYECKPQNIEAEQDLSYVEEFHDVIGDAYEKCKSFLWSMSGH